MSFLLNELKRIDPETYIGCMEGKIEEYQHTIDEQAKQLVAANHRYADLQQVCDGQDEQITTLKAALLTEKSYHLYYKCQGDCGRGICSAGAHKKDARVALARELPEIFQEDK